MNHSFQLEIKELKIENKLLKKRITRLEEQMKDQSSQHTVQITQFKTINKRRNLSSQSLKQLLETSRNDTSMNTSACLSQKSSDQFNKQKYQEIISTYEKQIQTLQRKLTQQQQKSFTFIHQFKPQEVENFKAKLKQFVLSYQKKQKTLNQLSIALDLQQPKDGYLNQINQLYDNFNNMMKQTQDFINNLTLNNISLSKQKQTLLIKLERLSFINAHNKKRIQTSFQQQSNPQQIQQTKLNFKPISQSQIINNTYNNNNYKHMLDQINLKLSKNPCLKRVPDEIIDYNKKDVTIIHQIVLPIKQNQSKFVKKHILRTVSRSRNNIK